MSQLKTKEEIIHWLKDKAQLEPENITFNEDLSVSVNCSVNLSNKQLTEIPFNFKEVGGTFSCAYNDLTSLEGCPEQVGGSFNCSHNNLTSLEYSPKEVGESFICNNNKLTSLKFCPEKVGGSFYCKKNELTSLEGCPEQVGEFFDCSNNKLTSLKGCPKNIPFAFSCERNKINTLEFLPEQVGFRNNLGLDDLRYIYPTLPEDPDFQDFQKEQFKIITAKERSTLAQAIESPEPTQSQSPKFRSKI